MGGSCTGLRNAAGVTSMAAPPTIGDRLGWAAAGAAASEALPLLPCLVLPPPYQRRPRPAPLLCSPHCKFWPPPVLCLCRFVTLGLQCSLYFLALFATVPFNASTDTARGCAPAAGAHWVGKPAHNAVSSMGGSRREWPCAAHNTQLNEATQANNEGSGLWTPESHRCAVLRANAV